MRMQATLTVAALVMLAWMLDGWLNIALRAIVEANALP